VLLISSWLQFWLVSVVPKHFKFATFSKEPSISENIGNVQKIDMKVYEPLLLNLVKSGNMYSTCVLWDFVYPDCPAVGWRASVPCLAGGGRDFPIRHCIQPPIQRIPRAINMKTKFPMHKVDHLHAMPRLNTRGAWSQEGLHLYEVRFQFHVKQGLQRTGKGKVVPVLN
jgi:hypothetical protein